MSDLVTCVLNEHGVILCTSAGWPALLRAHGVDEHIAHGVGIRYADCLAAISGTETACEVQGSVDRLLREGTPFSSRVTSPEPSPPGWFEVAGDRLNTGDGAARFLISHRPIPGLAEEIRAGEIIDVLDEGMIALDAEQRVVLFNRAAERIFGVDAVDAMGKPLDRFLPAKVRSVHPRLIDSLAPSHVSRRMSTLDRLVTGLRADGSEVALSVRICTARWGDEDLRIALVRDLTVLRTLEENERALRDQLEHSQRFEALGQLAGGLAHEVNNALAIVLANVELLDASGPEATAIVDATQHAADVLRQLLTFARGTAEPASDCDLVEEARHSVELLRATLPVSLLVSLELSEASLPVALSRQELRQILFNLLTNASHALGGQGQVRVRVEPAGERVHVRVEDDGPGIEPDIAERIFEPFISTKQPAAGSGLGLSVVHGILARRGASIELVPSSLGGAGFLISLQRVASGTRVPVSPKHEAPDGVRVLLVDDEEVLARSLGRLLRSRGFEVHVCHRLDQARALLAERPIDVLVSDQSMPAGSGLDLVRELRARGDRIACAILTGGADAALQRRVDELDCALANKPIDREGLLRLIRRAIERAARPASG